MLLARSDRNARAGSGASLRRQARMLAARHSRGIRHSNDAPPPHANHHESGRSVRDDVRHCAGQRLAVDEYRSETCATYGLKPDTTETGPD